MVALTKMQTPVPSTVLDQAQDLIDRGSEMDLHRARRLLRSELSRDDDNPYIHDQLSKVHTLLGDHEEAIREMKNAIRLAPDEVGLLHNLGITYKLAGRYAEAADAYQQALEAIPDGRTDKEAVVVRRLAKLYKLICDIGAARQSDKGGAQIVEEMRR